MYWYIWRHKLTKVVLLSPSPWTRWLATLWKIWCHALRIFTAHTSMPLSMHSSLSGRNTRAQSKSADLLENFKGNLCLHLELSDYIVLDFKSKPFSSTGTMKSQASMHQLNCSWTDCFIPFYPCCTPLSLNDVPQCQMPCSFWSSTRYFRCFFCFIFLYSKAQDSCHTTVLGKIKKF